METLKMLTYEERLKKIKNVVERVFIYMIQRSFADD